MPTSYAAAPWHIYLLIDPSTGPGNHALGTIFYVGLRSDLPEPVDLREVTEPQSLPEAEVATRERLERLNREGVRVLVEVIPEQWHERTNPPGLPRVVGTLCATLHPAPLNERHKAVRWPASFVQTIERAEEMPLPEGGVIIRRHQERVPIAALSVLDPDELFEQQVALVEGRASPRDVSNRLHEDDPVPLFLVSDGRRERGVTPSNFVLGVWLVQSIEAVDSELTKWRVVRADDPETEGALRRRYLHQRVDLRSLDALHLRNT